MRARSNWKDGGRDGLNEEWFSNGQMRKRDNFKDGGRDGLSEWWYENGQMSRRDNWKDGKREGLNETWYDNGQMEMRENWKDGELDGLSETWYDNGQMRERENWKDGGRDGRRETWHSNGQMRERENWKDGERDGLSETWYDNGQMRARSNWKDGGRDGLNEEWFSNGQMSRRENWKDGRLDGLREAWYDNGQMWKRENFKDGELDGLREAWYDNGQMWKRENFKNGIKVAMPVELEDGALYRDEAEGERERNTRSAVSAFQKIAEGADFVPNAVVRNDLKEYGGVANVGIYWGVAGDASRSYKGGYGISHIGAKHGGEVVRQILDVLVNGEIVRESKGNKTVLLSNGEFECVLALTRFGNKETWLLTGWDKIDKTGGNSEVSAQSVPMQGSPTFSRTDLGAALSDVAKLERNPETASDAEGKVSGRALSRKEMEGKAAYASRQWRRMKALSKEWTEKLHTAGITEVYDSIDDVPGSVGFSARRRRSKGWYDPKTGRIVIVLGNHNSPEDVLRTILHESVAHYGLRKLFGKHFDDFLDNVYNAAEEEVRHNIDAKMQALKGKTEGSTRTEEGWRRAATEEYLGDLSEEGDFENAERRPFVEHWFNKIKQFFLKMLNKLGLKGFGENVKNLLSDNELRYILWRSYQNMANPGRYRNIFQTAEDIAMQDRLGVGDYAKEEKRDGFAAEEREMQEVNERFNEELDDFKNGTLDGLLHLGKPSAILKACGVNVSEMTLSPSVLHTHLKKHNLTTDDLKGLALSMRTPIMVYVHGKNKPNIVVVTELDVNGGKLSATLKLDSNGEVVEIANISSVHSKDAEKELQRLYQMGEEDFSNSLKWVDKQKVLQWIAPRPSKTSDTQNNDAPFDVAKVINDFESPTIWEEKVSEDNVMFRDGKVDADDVSNVARGLREEYDKAMKRSGFQMQEALQDSMLSVKKLMDIVGRHSGKEKVADWENAYMAENALSSRNKAEQTEFERKHYKPIMEAMRLLKEEGMTEDDIYDYVMEKHGIERNREMAVRAKLTDKEGKTDKALLEAWNKRKEEVRNDAALDTWEKKQRRLDEIAATEFGADLYGRDYSGLTSVMDIEDVHDAVEAAYVSVVETEAAHGVSTAKLQEEIRKANAAILDKMFTSGMISRATRDGIGEMYEYYVPLRGFDEKTAEEVYAYLNNEKHSFNKPLKRAKGRSSKADNPIANMMSMADSAIMQGNKNLMKLKFLNFVFNRPSDLVSVSDMWVEYDAAADEWRAKFPEIPYDATADEVAETVRQFNEKMEAEAAKKDATVKRIKGSTGDVPYRTLYNQMSEHQVVVKRNGREYVLTVNGDPRAAMALNGRTNPQADYGSVGGAAMKAADYINRNLASFYTTKNPDFVASNFVRDAIYSNTMVWVKESPRYAATFHKNFVKYNPKKMGVLFHKFNHGTLDMGNPTEKEFYNFMINGGETGYSNLKEMEELKKQLTKDLKDTALHQMKAFLDRLEIINRSVENCARFAAYMTSREEGRSVERAVWDAKEISVNFNKKGAGGTFFGKTGQTTAGSWVAAGSAAGRAFYVFFNAGVQGTTNLLKAAHKHPAKFSGIVAAGYFVLGCLAPALMGSGGDGDDDGDNNTKYEDLPDYVRRTNLIIKNPFGKDYFSLPLPIEFRVMYGMGELATSVLTGKQRYSTEELSRTIAEQFTQALPINFLEGEGTGVLSPFVPSFAAPLWQAHQNKDWTGMPIYKKNEWNEKKPEWTKAFGRTNRHLVDAAKWLNEKSGGNEFKKGVIDLNPALVESVAEGYFGGALTFLNKMSNSVDMATGKMDFDWRNVPIANRMVKSGTASTKQRAINREYFKNVEKWEALRQEERGCVSKLQNPKTSLLEKAEWLTRLKEIHRSEEWKNMFIFNQMAKGVTKMSDALKAKPEEDKALERDIWELKKRANEVARGEWDEEEEEKKQEEVKR
jgi:antitoxin component YwqK of YwqJK toxin-antitoxin module